MTIPYGVVVTSLPFPPLPFLLPTLIPSFHLVILKETFKPEPLISQVLGTRDINLDKILDTSLKTLQYSGKIVTQIKYYNMHINSHVTLSS